MRLNEDLSIEILIHEVEKLNSKEVVPLEREEFLKLKDSLLMDTYNFYPFFNMYLEVVNGKISSYWSTRIDQNFFPYKEYYYRGEVCGIEGLFIVKKCNKIVLSHLNFSLRYNKS